MTALAPVLQAFFTDRLIAQRNASPHTIAGYRDATGGWPRSTRCSDTPRCVTEHAAVIQRVLAIPPKRTTIIAVPATRVMVRASVDCWAMVRSAVKPSTRAASCIPVAPS